MNGISLPTNDRIPAASKRLLANVQKQLGIVRNLMRLLSSSPAALNGYLSLNSALAKGSLGAKTGERIALAIAETNACGYCLSAHTYLGTNVAKLSEAEMAANRQGTSIDPKAGAALRFAVRIALARGHVSDAELQAVKAAGYSEAEILEIVVQVALNILTNSVNEVARTAIDFPAVLPAVRAVA